MNNLFIGSESAEEEEEETAATPTTAITAVLVPRNAQNRFAFIYMHNINDNWCSTSYTSSLSFPSSSSSSLVEASTGERTMCP